MTEKAVEIPLPCQEHFAKRNHMIWKHKCHYFVIGAGIWVTDPDLFKALKKHKRNATSCKIALVWFIPGEMSKTEYVIDCDTGTPRVHGRELIAEISYDKWTPKKR